MRRFFGKLCGEQKSDWFLFAVFYLVAHVGLLLIPNAIYWDDWVLYRAKPGVIVERFTEQAGTLFYLEGYIHLILLKAGPWIYKVLTFFSFLFAAFGLNLVLKRISEVDRDSRFVIVLLFLVLPFNTARVALVDLRYTICYAMFFLAWSLMFRYPRLALLLFFSSFNTNSLLVFYALPMVDLFRQSGALSCWRSFSRGLLRYYGFILLPFLYFGLKLVYFSPTGAYAGYNEGFGFRSLLYLPFFQIYDLISANVSLGLALFFSMVSFLLLRYRASETLSESVVAPPGPLLVAGSLVLLAGAIPYWIVGLLPTFLEWSSRHQLLLPLGGSLLIAGCLRFSGKSAEKLSLSIILGLSLASTVVNYLDYFRDWQKQRQIVAFFAGNEKLAGSGLILIDDRSEGLNAIKRTYRFYEWNGLLELAYGNERHFAIRPSELKDYRQGNYDRYISAMYKAGDFSWEMPARVPLLTIEAVVHEHFSDKIINAFFPSISFKVSEFVTDAPPVN